MRNERRKREIEMPELKLEVGALREFNLEVTEMLLRTAGLGLTMQWVDLFSVDFGYLNTKPSNSRLQVKSESYKKWMETLCQWMKKCAETLKEERARFELSQESEECFVEKVRQQILCVMKFYQQEWTAIDSTIVPEIDIQNTTSAYIKNYDLKFEW